MKFVEVAGHRAIINRITKNVLNGRISHAQMLIGHEGTGKIALALAYAQFVNCSDKKIFGENSSLYADSCGVCPSCVKSQKLIHPDIHFVFPVTLTKKHPKKAISKEFYPEWRVFLQENRYYVDLNMWYEAIEVENKQGIISAEECNEVIDTLNYKTYEGEYKIVVIWMIEKLFHSAAPKLLKMLEEPPEKTLFLVISDDYQQVLETILSRVQLTKLNKLSKQDIIMYFSDKPEYTNDKIINLCHKYNNNLIKIIQYINNKDEKNEFMEMYIEWMRICYRGKVSPFIQMANEFKDMGREKQKLFLEFCLIQLRNSFMIPYSQQLLSFQDTEKIEFYGNFGKYLNKINIVAISEILNEAAFFIERNANPKILFTDISFRIGSYLNSAK